MRRAIKSAAVVIAVLMCMAAGAEAWDVPGAWDSFQALLARANTWSGTQTIDTLEIGADGVQLTNDSDGAITFTGLGNGSDEDLTLNFDDTANTVAISSSTGVTDIDAGTINLVTTGTVSGDIYVVNVAASCTIGTDCDSTSTQVVNGGMIFVTATATVTLPAVGIGNSVCVYSTTAAAVHVDANASDRIRLDGTALDDGDKVSSASAAGDFICFIGDSADGWTTLGRSGTWTDGS